MKKNKRVDDPRKIAEIMRHIQIQRQASFRSPYTCMLACSALLRSVEAIQVLTGKFGEVHAGF